MSKTYFISDLHFHHKNILKYEPCRVNALADYAVSKNNHLFKEEVVASVNHALANNDYKILDVWLNIHDEMLIKNWNDIVHDDDTVWFLGDLALGSKTMAKELCKRLKGHKRMVRGNHDIWSDAVYYDMGFEYVSKYPVVLKGKFILSHAPIEYNCGEMFNIFGHVHSNVDYGIYNGPFNSQCVCVELQDFSPMRIKEYDNTN